MQSVDYNASEKFAAHQKFTNQPENAKKKLLIPLRFLRQQRYVPVTDPTVTATAASTLLHKYTPIAECIAPHTAQLQYTTVNIPPADQQIHSIEASLLWPVSKLYDKMCKMLSLRELEQHGVSLYEYHVGDAEQKEQQPDEPDAIEAPAKERHRKKSITIKRRGSAIDDDDTRSRHSQQHVDDTDEYNKTLHVTDLMNTALTDLDAQPEDASKSSAATIYYNSAAEALHHPMQPYTVAPYLKITRDGRTSIHRVERYERPQQHKSTEVPQEKHNPTIQKLMTDFGFGLGHNEIKVIDGSRPSMVALHIGGYVVYAQL